MLRREAFWRATWIVEAAAVGWFFVQALRYLLGMLYAHVSSADIVLRLGDPGPTVPGVVLPADAQIEVGIVAVAILTPLLAFLLARRSVAFVITVTLVAIGRVFMTLATPPVGVLGAAIVVAGGMLYFAALSRQQPGRLAVALTLGFVIDQIVRAYGQTLDPTWGEAFLYPQTVISIVLFVIAVVRAASRRNPPLKDGVAYSGIGLGGGIALGGLLFLELALLATPAAMARWTGIDYSWAAPWLIAATALPLIPEVRETARQALSLVDAQWRGWFWLLLICLLLVLGNRLDGVVAFVALLMAQGMTVLLFWWIARPVGKDQSDVTGPALMLSLIVLALLFGGDFFTYEYAFVRDFSGGLDWLSGLLRSLRGLGLGVMVVAVLLAAIPLMDAARRAPWRRGSGGETLAGVAATVLAAALVAVLAGPVPVSGYSAGNRVRVGTYNLHGGYSLYFDYDLAGLGDTIWESGADVVLLQEVDAGRLVSFGVDQALWLGRRLGMDVRYLATNEHLQGLAVLSRVPITLSEGVLLTSQGMQTGVQRVQVRPDEEALDIYNTWLGLLFAQDAAALDEQEQDQWQQIQEVLALISANHPGGVVSRVVLGGTFNNTPDSELYQLVNQTGFSDPFDGMPLDRSATLLRGDSIQVRFDYLWLRNILPTGRAVLERDASDHRMAVVELNLE